MSARFSLPPSNPFSNWNINQRYEHQGNFSLAVVDPHKAGAAHIRSLINNAMMDGLL